MDKTPQRREARGDELLYGAERRDVIQMKATQRAIGTTVLAVRRGDQLAVAGDGQVTIQTTKVKLGANKLRRLYHDKVIVGFAGAAADAIALFEKLEGKLEASRGHLGRAAYELAKDWRTDRVLRRLEAMLIAADKEDLLIISGSGDIIEPDDGVAGIGVGAPYAIAAARALIRNTEMTAEQVAREAMSITAEIDIYTNDRITIETLP
jgi:ATP-dependent HslUV protease subunit HslV